MDYSPSSTRSARSSSRFSNGKSINSIVYSNYKLFLILADTYEYLICTGSGFDLWKLEIINVMHCAFFFFKHMNSVIYYIHLFLCTHVRKCVYFKVIYVVLESVYLLLYDPVMKQIFFFSD